MKSKFDRNKKKFRAEYSEPIIWGRRGQSPFNLTCDWLMSIKWQSLWRIKNAWDFFCHFLTHWCIFFVKLRFHTLCVKLYWPVTRSICHVTNLFRLQYFLWIAAHFCYYQHILKGLRTDTNNQREVQSGLLCEARKCSTPIKSSFLLSHPPTFSHINVSAASAS